MSTREQRRWQSELDSLKKSLLSKDRSVQKEAVKQTIAYMTIAKDVSSLFTHVLNCINTDDIETKKMIYLYLMNYANTKPDLSILAVNTFVKDAEDPNPLVRSLAIRTMGSIRVKEVVEYLCQPLRVCLKDKNSYVKKTAAICVAKLFSLDPELIESQGLIEDLLELISDSNSVVVTNALVALLDINSLTTTPVFELTKSTVNKILNAIKEANEWGQIYIMDALSHFPITKKKYAERIMEIISPRLNHSNSAVVLSAVKLILKCFDSYEDKNELKAYKTKVNKSLISLLTKGPEIQYVALRNINLILQKHPDFLRKDVKHFFCRYNDPIYVKMEKLEIIPKIVDTETIEIVLKELKLYALEVDVDFVRKAVKAIGQCAIKLPPAAGICVRALVELVESKRNYIIQETIIVAKDIFRRYPGKYESIISPLCNNLTGLDDSEAKACMVWIIGEYSEQIVGADTLIDMFLDNFVNEASEVKQELLTAVVKMYCRDPDNMEDMVQDLLEEITENSDDPDLRDRAFFYWRLVASDLEFASKIILKKKPLISYNMNDIQEDLLDELLEEIPAYSSVFYKRESDFVTKVKYYLGVSSEESHDDDEMGILEGGEEGHPAKKDEGAAKEENSGTTGGALIDFGDVQSVPQVAPSSTAPPVNLLDDLFGAGPAGAGQGGRRDLGSDLPPLIAPKDAKGLGVYAQFSQVGDKIVFQVDLVNTTEDTTMSGFAIAFDKNSFGLKPSSVLYSGQIPPQQKRRVTVDCAIVESQFRPGQEVSSRINIAIKNNLGVFYSAKKFDIFYLFSHSGLLSKSEFLRVWSSIPDDNEEVFEMEGVRDVDPGIIKTKLEDRRVYFVARRMENGNPVLYFSLKLINGTHALVEITVIPQKAYLQVAVRIEDLTYLTLIENDIAEILG